MEAILPFYGRRKGRPLRNTSKRLLEELLPAYVVPDNTSDPDKLFTHNPRKLYLEIGFGGGEHLAMVAKNHPENAYIGAEPFLNGVSSFLKYCQDEALKNVRIWPDDIRLQLSSWPNECLDGIFIMFPDPLPKIRHSSRRIINKDNLAAFARLIKVSGSLRMASDHSSAKNWILSGMLENPYFDWTAESPDDWNVQPRDCPETRYMRKALKEGRRPAWFDFKRVLVEPS
jgi:tRNA (guanine-N7-)-methyltransferase